MPYFPRVVCHIEYGKSIIIGTNALASSPKWRKKHADGNISFSRHAEEHALAQLPHDVSPHRIRVRVYRYKKNGALAMAKPCHHCMEKMLAMGIKQRQIKYSNDHGQMERCL